MMARQVGTSGQLFPTGVVGSMPRPQFLRDLLDPRAEGHTPVRRVCAAARRRNAIHHRYAGGRRPRPDLRWRMAAPVVLRRDRRDHARLRGLRRRRRARQGTSLPYGGRANDSAPTRPHCGRGPLSRPAYRPDDEGLPAITLPAGATAVGSRSGPAAPTLRGKRSCRRWSRSSGTSWRPWPGPG